MSASEYFESVRAAVRDLARAKAALEAAQQAVDGLGNSGSAGGGGSSFPTSWGHLNRIASVDSASEGYAAAVESYGETVAEAERTIERIDTGNASRSSRYREALTYRYVLDYQVAEASEAMHVSQDAVKRFQRDALEWCDSHGLC